MPAISDCGECTTCCTLTYVPELKKAENITCIHCSEGCSIYERRPNSCKKYECAWYSGLVEKHLRPDKCGVMFEVYDKMVAALLLPGTKLTDLPMEQIEKFVSEGKPVIATGQFARLPVGMTSKEAKQILISTVREVYHGPSSIHN